VAFNVVPTQPDGTLALADLRARVRGSAPGDGHAALTAVLCLESTHNRCGGAVLPLAYLDAVKDWADGVGLPIHLDGARLFNAAAALGVPPAAIAARVTTLTFCLSKGAGAPAGSVVCGPTDAIARARRWRKMLGGGLRQAGVLAAAGRIALDEAVDLAVADARRAARLAAGLASIPGVVVDNDPPHSNIVIFGLGSGEGAAAVAAGDDDDGGGRAGRLTHEALVSALATEHGVRVAPFRGRIRAVTSREVGDEDVDAAVAAVRAVVEGA
jgi:threonine aldolase